MDSRPVRIFCNRGEIMSEPITDKEFETIKVIEEFGPYISQREVAEKLDISRTAAQHRIEQLERKGWIRREIMPSPGGKREPRKGHKLIIIGAVDESNH